MNTRQSLGNKKPGKPELCNRHNQVVKKKKLAEKANDLLESRRDEQRGCYSHAIRGDKGFSKVSSIKVRKSIAEISKRVSCIKRE